MEGETYVQIRVLHNSGLPLVSRESLRDNSFLYLPHAQLHSSRLVIFIISILWSALTALG